MQHLFRVAILVHDFRAHERGIVCCCLFDMVERNVDEHKENIMLHCVLFIVESLKEVFAFL